MSLKPIKPFSLPLILIASADVEKNDDELRNQTANLESQISSIDNELVAVWSLQEQGKLNSK